MRGLFLFLRYVIIHRRARNYYCSIVYSYVFWFKKIPELAKGLGRAMREVKDASNDIKKEIRNSAGSIKDDLDITK